MVTAVEIERYAAFQLPTDERLSLPIGEMPGLPELVPALELSASRFGLSESESHFAIDGVSGPLHPNRAGLQALAALYRAQVGSFTRVEGTWQRDSDDEYPI